MRGFAPVAESGILHFHEVAHLTFIADYASRTNIAKGPTVVFSPTLLSRMYEV